MYREDFDLSEMMMGLMLLGIVGSMTRTFLQESPQKGIDYETAYRLGKEMQELGGFLAEEKWDSALFSLSVVHGKLVGLGWNKEMTDIVTEIREAIKAKNADKALTSFVGLEGKILRKMR